MKKISREQAEYLLEIIEANFNWAIQKGMHVTLERKFIENIIRLSAGCEERIGDTDAKIDE